MKATMHSRLHAAIRNGLRFIVLVPVFLGCGWRCTRIGFCNRDTADVKRGTIHLQPEIRLAILAVLKRHI
jgi:hypothetical protein